MENKQTVVLSMTIFDKMIKTNIVSGDKFGYEVKSTTYTQVVEGKRDDFVCQERETSLVITLPEDSVEMQAIQNLRAAGQHGLFNGDDAVATILFQLLDRQNWLLDICQELGGCCDEPAAVCRWCERDCRNAGKRRQAIIASRHEATISYLQQWFADKNIDTVVKTSVSKEDVAGKVVAGNLPAHLAKLCKIYIAVDLPTGCPRGEELEAEYITANAKLEAYDVSFLGEAYEMF